ncbi:hypothetical protein C9374_002281 [Naegleria lovaniensis]|uniref:Guanine nucleotide-binding protein subunit beta-like protein n=1 Tax=Naegleria lovaniensis TaxID=51637 RepID=A0AA88GT38_NAELO|nr:uncharacterized protein C9374_002281 [Naegleria lovaniensis]KAG2386537.1 hypothetical protein C9374_002281 [Naegleria lovaniensis]
MTSKGPIKMTRSELYSALMDSEEEEYYKELKQEEEELFNKKGRSKFQDLSNSFGSDNTYNASDGDEDDEYEDDTLEGTLRMIEKKKKKIEEEKIPELKRRQSPTPELKKEPEVIEDFIRNFLSKKGLEESLRIFNDELYEKKQKGELDESADAVPDAYTQLQRVEEELHFCKKQLEQQKQLSENVVQKFEKLRRVKDHHKMSHMQTVQTRDQLRKELERMKNHCAKYEPFIAELTNKYDKVFKEKTLVCLERDRLANRVTELENIIRQQNGESTSVNNTTNNEMEKGKKTKTIKKTKKKDSVLPPEKKNPFREKKMARTMAETFQLSQNYESHSMAISGLAVHSKKPIVATASDDGTWKAWSLPSSKVIMSGEGHSDWVSGIDFHPFGTHLATSGGDCLIKLWDFTTASCSLTFDDHTLPVWDCQFHYSGDFLVSCSMDQTTKLFDIRAERCVTTFRGHKDSVNSVVCIPFTNTLLTASADKTLSLWDMRADSKNLCVQTYYGHKNSCNYVTINPQGDTMASTDCDGLVLVWDLRTQKIRNQFNISDVPTSANKCAFDPSGKVLAVACADTSIRLFCPDGIKEDESSKPNYTIGELKGNKEAVQVVKFDSEGKYVVSGSDDGMLCLFNN